MKELHNYCGRVAYGREQLKDLLRQGMEPVDTTKPHIVDERPIRDVDDVVRACHDAARKRIDQGDLRPSQFNDLYSATGELLKSWSGFVDAILDVHGEPREFDAVAELRLNQAIAVLDPLIPKSAFQEQIRKKTAESGDETPEAESQGPDNSSGQDQAADVDTKKTDSGGTIKRSVAVGYLKNAGVPQSSAYRMLERFGETISTVDLERLKQIASEKAAKRDRDR
jgi:hypothetical protein